MLAEDVGQVSREEDTVRGVMRWAIPDFAKLNHKAGDMVDSPVFTGAGRRWFLRLYPGGLEDGRDRKVWIGICLLGARMEEVEAKVSLAAVRLATDGPVELTSTKKFIRFGPRLKDHDVEPDYNTTEFSEHRKSTTLSRDCLLDKGNEYLFGGALTLQVSIKVKMFADDRFDRQEQRAKRLSKHLTSLLKSDDNGDVTFVLQDGKVRTAHRLILAARSPVFKAMFAARMTEASEGKVLLDDVCARVWDALLHVVYGGGLSVNDMCGKSSPRSDSDDDATLDAGAQTDFAIRLLAAADRYEIKDLVIMCTTHLTGTLAINNFAMILAAAHKNYGAGLLNACLAYVRAKPERLIAIQATEGYKQLDKTHLDTLLGALATPSASKKRRRDDEKDENERSAKSART